MELPIEFQRAMLEMDQMCMAANLRAIQADPEAHKKTMIMEPGKGAGYRYFQAKNGRGSPVLFCYSKHRNAAGYFLVWTEKHTKKEVRRIDFSAVKSKKSAVGLARRRHTDFVDK